MNSTSTVIILSDLVTNTTIRSEPVAHVLNFIEGFLILCAVLIVVLGIIVCIEKTFCTPVPVETIPVKYSPRTHRALHCFEQNNAHCAFFNENN